ncbi:MAG TPA: alpha/beta hydrolase [Mycobacteriales bacterium]|nr:alpha/beta hydrolase [Mycobacteriales bacterium]
MGKRLVRLSALGAGLTLNALRPFPSGNPLAIPSFFTGWLTTELAPQNLIVTAATSGALALKRRGRLTRDDKLALGLNAISAAGLAALIAQGLKVHKVVDAALVEALGPEYLTRVAPTPTEDELTTPWREVLMPWRTHHQDVKRIRNIPYVGGEDAHKRNRLDLFVPREPGEKRPVLLQIHGGGWVIGNKEEQGVPLMTYLSARGWVCAAPNYPLSPKATWPEHLIAIKQSLAWIRANIAEYGGDPSYVVVTGGSAGGHLAAMVALTANDPKYQPGFEDVDTSVRACVPFYGVYDLANLLDTKAGEREYKHFLAPTLFKSKDRELARSASPLALIRSDAPPFFIIHGRNDSLVNVAEARELARALRETSESVVAYAELPGAQHAFDVFASIRSAHVIRAVERFLRIVRSNDTPKIEAVTRASA